MNTRPNEEKVIIFWEKNIIVSIFWQRYRNGVVKCFCDMRKNNKSKFWYDLKEKHRWRKNSKKFIALGKLH